jgi:hypothetical protein
MPRQKDWDLAKLKREKLQYYGEIYYMWNTENGKGYIGQTQLLTELTIGITEAKLGRLNIFTRR